MPLLFSPSLFLAFALGPQEAPEVSFQRDVLPVLSDRCFLCHGPDGSSREAGLRLDLEGAARESGVLEVDESGYSEFLERIAEAEDPLYNMPPAAANLALTDEERRVLQAWVRAGAPYGTHWAFEPLPAQVDPPGVSAEDPWGRTALDRFVASVHRGRGLEPTPPASPERWLRRVTLDLTGLPPSHQEIAAFLGDSSQGAKARVVERLLDSEAFGERMATPWLDAARYADSYGYQSDLLSPTWPWRDWVVGAFNGNLPYDEFLAEQLAGDLVPEPTRNQRLATAFQRLHRMTNEGGSVEAEWRHAYGVDRVQTLGSAMMGLTLQCAQCHDHKFDPITQSEFYGLFGFFHSVDEWGTYHDSSRVPTPSLLLPDQEQARELGRLEAKVAALNAELERLPEERAEGAQPWGPGAGPDPLLYFAFDQVDGEGLLDGCIEGVLDAGTARIPASAKLVEGVPPASPPAGSDPRPPNRALEMGGDEALQLPDVGLDFGPDKSFSVSFWLRLPEEGIEDGVVLHRTGGTDVGYFGFDMVLSDGALQARQVRFWPGNAAALESHAVPRGEWFHVAYVQRGSGLARDMQLFVDGEPAGTVLRDGLTKLPEAGPGGLALGARFRDRGLAGGAIDELSVFGRALSRAEVQGLRSRPRWPGDWGTYRGPGLSPPLARRPKGPRPVSDGVRAQLEASLRETYVQKLRLQTKMVEVPVMEELYPVRTAHTLHRGDYDAPRGPDNVAPRRFPAALGGVPESTGATLDRLDLARWLTAPAHPLTARVAVNRFWQIFFGAGLVATPDDFGLQGSYPSHPELLDWLARDFVESGWDVKRLCREIVLSSTYGQDSACADEARAMDPENRWLARGPSIRLSAEMLRDQALFASGLLSREMGGPPVSPYQPPGLWRESNSMSPAYVQSVGQDLHRRSLYSVVKRTAPLPNMVTFDRPMRETSCARRESTGTPLQGLVLLNDVQFVEASRALAERAMGEREDPSDRIAFMFEALTGRSPDAFEAALLAELMDEGSLVSVAQTILSLDAAVWKR